MPASDAAFEIEAVRPERTDAFFRTHEREALSTLWGFRIVWHEQTHDLAATDGEQIIGALRATIAASLCRIERFVVAPERRRSGLGRALLARAEEIANYYNCHKMTLEVLAGGGAQTFFERCDYKVEAVLPQHTWKLDVAVMRKFLL